jgi:hypothetical protein
MDAKYRMPEENRLLAKIEACVTQIESLQTERTKLEEKLEGAGNLRRLLFEQGKALEMTVLEAMRLFGFQAEPLKNAESEFDAVLVSPEGRALGEAEGKDRKAINIDKFSQLERNLQEDFAHDAVEKHAKGILFGNAHRLMPLSERGEFFTAKCMSAAKRIGAALVRTPDLFEPAKYLKHHPGDVSYAGKCRAAIMSAEGDIVVFPPVPPAAVETSASAA